MTVIACRECHQPVSTEAPACPHCGCPTDPKPAKAGKPEKGSLGNDPRCYVCSLPAKRACSRCGQFCCDLHINAPSAHHPAVCHPCQRANGWLMFYVFIFIIILMAIMNGWRVYEYFNPRPKVKWPDHSEFLREHEEKFRKSFPSPHK